MIFKLVFLVLILLLFVKILNSVGCRQLVFVFLASIGIKAMKTVSYYDYFAYLIGGDPTETESSNKTNVYAGIMYYFETGKNEPAAKNGDIRRNRLAGDLKFKGFEP